MIFWPLICLLFHVTTVNFVIGTERAQHEGQSISLGWKKKGEGEKMKNVTSGWNWGISGFTGWKRGNLSSAQTHYIFFFFIRRLDRFSKTNGRFEKFYCSCFIFEWNDLLLLNLLEMYIWLLHCYSSLKY